MSIYDLCLDCGHERQHHGGQGLKCAVGDCLCQVGYRSRVKFRPNPREVPRPILKAIETTAVRSVRAFGPIG